MIVGPGGEFTMGSPASEAKPEDGESPQHPVRIAQSFAIGKFEVTISQFETFVKTSGYQVNERCSLWTGKEWKELPGSFREVGFPQTGRHPVACVNWNDARSYALWLARQTRRPYRLLTEAEWEYAARARTTTQYSFGNNTETLCEFANVADRTAKGKYSQWTVANCADGFINSAPVGSLKPNGFGLNDMHGNVSEWVEDCFQPDYRTSPSDGSAAPSANCPLRVLRGGSWIGHPKALRSASRLRRSPEDRYSNIGFRVARSLLPEELGPAKTAEPER
jgi:formylglycine-generating enzyme required for sulfatase activity